MKIELKKFGTTLISRAAGREALAALEPKLTGIKPGEEIEIDFEGVITFAPSWGDEFLTPLQNRFGDRLILLPTDNQSVRITIDILQKDSRQNFKFK